MMIGLTALIGLIYMTNTRPYRGSDYYYLASTSAVDPYLFEVHYNTTSYANLDSEMLPTQPTLREAKPCLGCGAVETERRGNRIMCSYCGRIMFYV